MKKTTTEYRALSGGLLVTLPGARPGEGAGQGLPVHGAQLYSTLNRDMVHPPVGLPLEGKTIGVQYFVGLVADTCRGLDSPIPLV